MSTEWALTFKIHYNVSCITKYLVCHQRLPQFKWLRCLSFFSRCEMMTYCEILNWGAIKTASVQHIQDALCCSVFVLLPQM